jgi:hypothetical protein
MTPPKPDTMADYPPESLQQNYVTTMTNSDIDQYITEKYDRIAALRLARKEMFEAIVLKAAAGCQSEYQMALDRRAKFKLE